MLTYGLPGMPLKIARVEYGKTADDNADATGLKKLLMFLVMDDLQFLVSEKYERCPFYAGHSLE